VSTLFISDLHLTGKRPQVIELFLKFLEHDAVNAEALYILGDFFEYWIGDEAISRPDHQPIITALKKLRSGGTPVYVMHGNRDFLMGSEFENASGCDLIADPTVIDLYGEKVLLTHGDYLCTDDAPYQEFRKMVRQAGWQKEFLSKSVEERDAIAQKYRSISKEISATKEPEIMDINQQTLVNEMKRYGVYTIIHGHTHRPAIHKFRIDGQNAKRAVLGDWYDQGSMLVVDDKSMNLVSIDIQSIEKYRITS
jgi:UDP-2,3-diacylglucosamine hydrolase